MSDPHATALELQAESAAPLFVDDEELRRRINPKLGRDRFRAEVRAAELRGFPRIHAQWGGRYWPAVRAWLDEDNGVRDNGYLGDAQDGPESFDAPERQVPRSQARPPQAAILDRAPGRARPHGLPRPLRPAASGR